MKRFIISGLTVAVLLAWSAPGHARQNIYKWVKDKYASSRDVLKDTQGSRVIKLPETQALAVVKKVMTDKLYMALAEYHKTRHQQDAEVTPDTVLPEEIVHQQEVELVDEDYGFILEVKLKDYGNRTRVTAVAWPIYRIHDVEAEEEANPEGSAGTTVEVKVKSGDQPAMVGMGPIFVMPILGRAADYNCQPLPDAPERAALLVRSFMYFLDQQIAAPDNPAPQSSAQPEAKTEAPAEPEPTPGEMTQ